jgi:hypothetical protein
MALVTDSNAFAARRSSVGDGDHIEGAPATGARQGLGCGDQILTGQPGDQPIAQRRVGDAQSLIERKVAVVRQVAEPEGGAAEVFEAAVDRFGGAVDVPGRSK